MALVTVSRFTDGAPEISLGQSGYISVWYTGGVSISLTKEEAQQLIDSLTALLAETPAEEVAA